MPVLQRPDAEIRYDVTGAGDPTLVFVHGLTCARNDWRLQVDAFAGRHRVVTCDLRGHGESTGEPDTLDPVTLGGDVAALCEALEVDAAVLIGHSMGCRVVTEAALAAPEHVSALVYADGSRQAFGDAAASLALLRAQFEARGGFAGLARMMFTEMFVDGCDTPGRDAIIDRAAATPDAAGRCLLENMVIWDAERAERALSRVEVPVLVLQSTDVNEARERISMAPGDTTAWTDLVASQCAHAIVEVIAEVGHFNMLDAPDEFNARIEAFLKTLAR